ncbi:MAG: hypothetical protein ACTSW1_06695 [Candidatus Hodarchaeales archaeon]
MKFLRVRRGMGAYAQLAIVILIIILVAVMVPAVGEFIKEILGIIFGR